MVMKVVKKDEFLSWEKRYRANFFNSVVGFKSVALVGTIDKKNQPNLAIVNSAVHFGSDPALMGILIRPSTVPRHTLSNIIERDNFTLNHVHSEIIDPAHQTSAKYLRGQSEFEAVGLTPEYSDVICAPYVSESRIKIGLQFRERLNIRTNHTILMIGEVVEVILPEEIVGEDGFVDLNHCGSVVGSGLDAYLTTEKIKRLSYARPETDLHALKYDR